MSRKIVSVLRNRFSKTVFAALLSFLIFSIIFGSSRNPDYKQIGFETLRDVAEDQARRTHIAIVDKFYRDRQEWTTSTLGTFLFKQDELTDISSQQNRNFKITVWKYWDWLKQRHVYKYGTAAIDPLEGCSVRNCVFSGEDDSLETADAVVVHLQRGVIPHVKNRNPKQIWIFLNDESPKNAFSLSKSKTSLKNFANVFNWSMTYRTDADIPVPYGRTVPLSDPLLKYFNLNKIMGLIPYWSKKRRDVLLTILISNCNVKFRTDFIKELQKYIPVDVYGSCSKNVTNKLRCPGHFRADCEPIAEYLFYLVLENSSCREYMTEKVWYHAYMKGAIPIIMGPSLGDCEGLLPPDSYLHVPITKNSTHIRGLADDILAISSDENYLVSLHSWRNHFKVVNEHGYFGTKSYHLCRVCEALNYNDVGEKTYSEKDLKWFLDPKLLCESGT